MKTMKFRTLKNPKETVTVNGVKIVPDEVIEVTLPKNSNKVMVGGNWPTEEPTEEDWLLGKLNVGEPEYLGVDNV